jgi:hypothetical protein
METILARAENVTQNMRTTVMSWALAFNAWFVIFFFADLNAHPFMKTALVIFAITMFIFNELQFDSAIVARGALAQDALALDSSSHYAKKVLSAPVGVQRAIMFLAMTSGIVTQILLVSKY